MLEGLLFPNCNVTWKYSIANISCRLCITVNNMQVVFFSVIRYGPVFIPTVHNLEISEF
jgi:hypothetical protein